MESLPHFAEGAVLLIDKPLTWTSFDVVNKIRNEIKIKKVGHAGTLDPLATGLLVVCTGKFTKQIDTYQAQEKEYTGVMRLDSTTPSYDLETEPDIFFDYSHISQADIMNNVSHFVGTFDQYPPKHSAKIINGRRAYEYARNGEEVEMKAREVTITAFEITAIELPYVSFRVICSKGTYIRSLAFDFGKKLGIGGHLTELRRTRIGAFHVNEAWNLTDFVQQVKAQRELDKIQNQQTQ